MEIYPHCDEHDDGIHDADNKLTIICLLKKD